MGLPRREGLWFDVVRWVEKVSATEERSVRVLQKQMENTANPLALLKDDTISLFRLGSQVNLVKVRMAREEA